MLKITRHEQAKFFFEKEKRAYKVTMIVDYDGRFVIAADRKDGKAEYGDLWAIDKATGRIMGFSPMMNNPEEYFKAVDNRAVYF